MIITPKQSYFNIQSRVFVRKTTKSAIVRKFRPVLSRIMERNTDELTFQRIWIFIRTPVYRSPLKTSCERKCAVRAIFVVKPPRKAYSLTSSAFLESGTPCPFLLFTSVFRGSLKQKRLPQWQVLWCFSMLLLIDYCLTCFESSSTMFLSMLSICEIFSGDRSVLFNMFNAASRLVSFCRKR